MEKGLREEIEIPQGINVKIENNKIIFEKSNDKIVRKLNSIIDFSLEENKIVLKTKKSSRTEKRVMGSMKAHIKNALAGLNEKFKYKLQVASVHFPITLIHDKQTNEIIIKNFLGEKKDRRIKLVPGVNISINKDIIELESVDIEKAGQTAANIEKGSKVRNRDRRIFQDGIFITEKPGRSFL
jgi:large subunit ribosomal protein L6